MANGPAMSAPYGQPDLANRHRLLNDAVLSRPETFGGVGSDKFAGLTNGFSGMAGPPTRWPMAIAPTYAPQFVSGASTTQKPRGSLGVFANPLIEACLRHSAIRRGESCRLTLIHARMHINA